MGKDVDNPDPFEQPQNIVNIQFSELLDSKPSSKSDLDDWRQLSRLKDANTKPLLLAQQVKPKGPISERPKYPDPEPGIVHQISPVEPSKSGSNRLRYPEPEAGIVPKKADPMSSIQSTGSTTVRIGQEINTPASDANNNTTGQGAANSNEIKARKVSETLANNRSGSVLKELLPTRSDFLPGDLKYGLFGGVSGAAARIAWNALEPMKPDTPTVPGSTIVQFWKDFKQSLRITGAIEGATWSLSLYEKVNGDDSAAKILHPGSIEIGTMATAQSFVGEKDLRWKVGAGVIVWGLARIFNGLALLTGDSNHDYLKDFRVLAQTLDGAAQSGNPQRMQESIDGWKSFGKTNEHTQEALRLAITTVEGGLDLKNLEPTKGILSRIVDFVSSSTSKDSQNTGSPKSFLSVSELQPLNEVEKRKLAMLQAAYGELLLDKGTQIGGAMIDKEDASDNQNAYYILGDTGFDIGGLALRNLLGAQRYLASLKVAANDPLQERVNHDVHNIIDPHQNLAKVFDQLKTMVEKKPKDAEGLRKWLEKRINDENGDPNKAKKTENQVSDAAPTLNDYVAAKLFRDQALLAMAYAAAAVDDKKGYSASESLKAVVSSLDSAENIGSKLKNHEGKVLDSDLRQLKSKLDELKKKIQSH